MQLDTNVSLIKGVGPKTAVKLEAAGIKTVEDLLYNLPKKYEDFSNITLIKDIKPGHVTLKIKFDHVAEKRYRRNLHITEAILNDDSSKTRALWFNQPYRPEQLKSSADFFVSGNYGFQRGRYLILNPSVEKVTDLPVQTSRILPIYKEIKGIRSYIFRRIISNLRPLITMLPESLPPEVISEEKLISLSESLITVHFPNDLTSINQAHQRIAFEELFVLQTASLLNKAQNAKLKSYKIPFDEPAAKKFVSKLPFKLTDAQRRSIWEIVKNFDSGSPMNRMLQGDVGSGKTVVAGMAAFMAANSGFQTAFMAPTEILASQHAETLSKLLTPFGLEVGLLIGSTKPKAKKMLKEQIKNGSVAITVGTHALIQQDVEFNRLGFVVIDEQHRFGVKQRQILLSKSKIMPHVLTMTATPIPRSLALTVYGELDLSILNELPKGRRPIKTKIESPNNRTKLYEHVDTEIESGRQVYVVCPQITSKGELSELKSVTEEYDKLNKTRFKHRRIALLHGQLKSDEKESVMNKFAIGEINILITTTVVEVGVDVPNASIMIIESADRFGLAQLHQLRGRVGRGGNQSYCYLIPSTSNQPSKRLRELEKSNDGFYLAEVDLNLRGPGEIYGKAQHGALDLRIASLADTKLIKRTRDAVERMLSRGTNLLQYKQLQSKVEYYQRLTTLN